LVSEVQAGKVTAEMAHADNGRLCWDCHRNVPHMGMNSLSSTPGAEFVEPMPPDPVPAWLQRALGHKPYEGPKQGK